MLVEDIQMKRVTFHGWCLSNIDKFRELDLAMCFPIFEW